MDWEVSWAASSLSLRMMANLSSREALDRARNAARTARESAVPARRRRPRSGPWRWRTSHQVRGVSGGGIWSGWGGEEEEGGVGVGAVERERERVRWVSGRTRDRSIGWKGRRSGGCKTLMGCEMWREEGGMVGWMEGGEDGVDRHCV